MDFALHDDLDGDMMNCVYEVVFMFPTSVICSCDILQIIEIIRGLTHLNKSTDILPEKYFGKS